MSAARPGRSFDSDPHVRLVLERERSRDLALARYARWDNWLHAPYRAFHARWQTACNAAADALVQGHPSAGLAEALSGVVGCLRQAGRHWRNVHRWDAAAGFGQMRAWETAPYLLDWGRTIGRYSAGPGPDGPGCLTGPGFPGPAPETSALLALLRTAAVHPDDLLPHLEFQAARPPGLASAADWLRLLGDVLLPPPDARSGEEWARQLVLPPDADELAVRVTAGEVGLLLASKTAWAALAARLAPATPPEVPAPARTADRPPAGDVGTQTSELPLPTDTPPAGPADPPPRRPRDKPPPVVYPVIRGLHRDRKLSVAGILSHLKTPEGKQAAELVDASLKAQDATRNGRKRTRTHVVRAALRGHYNPRPSK